MTHTPELWPFRKMHGLGNDFVIFDAREKALALSADDVRALANRKRGIGCDQLVVITKPPRLPFALETSETPAVYMHIFNADGSRVGACGNVTRCVAQILMQESGKATTAIQTDAGVLPAYMHGDTVTVNMGPAELDWADIPVREACDTLHMPVSEGPLTDPVGVNMGNPHAVFFVEDAEAVDLAAYGHTLEHHPFFPERVNVSAASLIAPQPANGAHSAPLPGIRLRVHERGVGITEACGTAACATLVAAVRRALIEGRRANIILDGGTLTVEWQADGTVLMTGPATLAFTGEVRI